MKKVILVTGGSSGLGLAMARKLAENGLIVYAASRNVGKLQGEAFKSLDMDVTNDSSVECAVNTILTAEGRIDILINNAGNGIAGPLYDIPVSTAQKQFDVNFFGVVRVSSAVLPAMIERGEGLVINIGSLAGLFGLPYQGLYSASKFAIEGYSESLRMELRNTGVQVTVVNPGDFKTGFTGNREKSGFRLVNPKLENEYKAAVSAIEKDENAGADPDVLATRVLKIIATPKPAHNYLVGAFGQTIVPFLKKVLPGSLFVKLMNGHYGIK